jgi:diadenosine tetraphosphate (Ap4A) HIT family hydrolase
MKKIENNPQLTAIKRKTISFPTRWLEEHGLLVGDILDFGCGYGIDTDRLKERGMSIIGYDNFYRNQYPKQRFDTIICNYVLNVLEPEEQAEVLIAISELLKPQGKAYFTVRRDLVQEGFRYHTIYKKYTYQCNVILPFLSLFKNKSCEIYEYQHYNQLTKNAAEPHCVFCQLSSNVELLCETATVVAFYDSYPVSPGHVLIIPKRHVPNYFDLSLHEQRAMWLVVNHCKNILLERFHPDGFNIGINVNEAAGQSIFHCHIHLIPRYKGDVDNPKGGVRGVIPLKQKY